MRVKVQEQIGINRQNVRHVEQGEHLELDVPGGNSIHPAVKDAAPRPFLNEYAGLKQIMKQKGLFDKQPLYYTYKILLTLSLLAVSVAFLFLVHNFWLQLLNAAFLSFVFTQISYLGHDQGHRQLFRTTRMTEIGGFIIGNFLVGWSWSWWLVKHNRHHGYPNQIGLDPDIEVPFLAFTEEEARSKKGFLRFTVKYQAYLILPLELLASLSFLIFSVRFILEKKAKYPAAELLVMTVHYLLYLALLLSHLSIWQAVVFI